MNKKMLISLCIFSLVSAFCAVAVLAAHSYTETLSDGTNVSGYTWIGLKTESGSDYVKGNANTMLINHLIYTLVLMS
jgi:hypothetical protein